MILTAPPSQSHSVTAITLRTPVPAGAFELSWNCWRNLLLSQNWGDLAEQFERPKSGLKLAMKLQDVAKACKW